jgi:hypothetical protein
MGVVVSLKSFNLIWVSFGGLVGRALYWRISMCTRHLHQSSASRHAYPLPTTHYLLPTTHNPDCYSVLHIAVTKQHFTGLE